MKKLFLLFTAASLAFVSCKKDNDLDRSGIFNGPAEKFQEGLAWTWVKLDKSGTPERVGISIDAKAMSTLDPGTDHEGGHNPANSLSLAFHPKASATPFKHVMLDWNPHGHEPEGMYDLAHFDFHFYMTSEAERLAIPLYEQDSLKFKNLPEEGYMPATYIPIPGGVPQMGKHWLDLNAPEANGEEFSQTFLYGSYDGQVTFYEPMITKAFIDANQVFVRDIAVPAKFAANGYYPTSMRITKENGITSIILEDFVYRTKS